MSCHGLQFVCLLTSMRLVMTPQPSLKTSFAAIIYEAQDFAIFTTTEPGVSAKGSLGGVAAKSLLKVPLVLTGGWGEYRGRKQFVFTAYEVEEAEAVFFLHRLIGLSRKVAEAAHAKFGAALGEVIEKEPAKLLTVTGIKQKTADKIVARWPQFAQVRLLTAALGPYDVSNSMVARIHQHFGNQAISIIRDDPYALTQVTGIGFVKADEIALAMGIDPMDPKRLQAGVDYCVMQATRNDGHSALLRSDLVKAAIEELRTAQADGLVERVVQAIEALIERDSLVEASAVHVAPSYLAHFESKILEWCRTDWSATSVLTQDLDAYVSEFEGRIGKRLGQRQKEAVALANTQPPIMIISGFAGTGKTTSSKASLDLYAARYGRDAIACCALSGIAAIRVGTQSGYPSSTIHSLLGYTANGWTYDRSNKLPHRVILLDEASMVPSDLMYRLMDAIDFEGGARLILLGDPAQLRPVGSGSPFADLIKHRVLPSVQLDHIYRNAEGQVITTFAADVRRGQVPAGYSDGAFDDFQFTNCGRKNYFAARKTMTTDEFRDFRLSINLDIGRRVLQAVSNAALSYREALRDGLWSEAVTGCQVISPMKDTPAGTIELNRHLQDLFNPRQSDSTEVQVGVVKLREGDKVVHLRNMDMGSVPMHGYVSPESGEDEHNDFKDDDNRVRVMNGQVGIVAFAGEIDGSPELHVRYPTEGRVVRYATSELASFCIDLAYALTVHKSQGSEYRKVIFVCSMSHYRMLDPQMIYTGMTRAKDYLNIVGESYAFSSGCKKVLDTQRVTCMDLWCQQEKMELEADVMPRPSTARQAQMAF